MFKKIIEFSVRNKLVVLLITIAIVVGGITSLPHIPLDAVPDITNNQVQVVTVSPSLAAEEVEQYVTYPIESFLANIPGVTELRSISRYGLSVITVVFEDNVPIMTARQFVGEQIQLASSEIPPGLGDPEMMPITTGLGEIYQYVLTVDSAHAGQYTDMDLRTIQDWIIKRQLAGLEGIIEVSSFGGRVQQYEVAVDPVRLMERGLAISEVIDALERNNANSGGSYVERGDKAFYIRTEGRVTNERDIGMIPICMAGDVPVRVRDIAKVQLGSPKRYGAMTMDGQGEVVGGITLMLKGANSSQAITNVKDRMESVQASLPAGVHIYPYLDRSELVGRTIDTVSENLILGGLIVIFVVVILLGNWRAGMVVASVIPLSMLFALILMRIFGVSANLMSLGAIDFGIVVDGAVIIVEGVLFYLHTHHHSKKMDSEEMDETVIHAASNIYRSAAFGVLIILVVFIPIFALQGIEGKMFRPMAQTVSFAILGSLILALTYVPAMTALMLRQTSDKPTFADRLMGWLRKRYIPSVTWSVKNPIPVIVASVVAVLFAVILFLRMGAEFVPTLDEGDLAMQMAVDPGSSLQHSIATAGKAEALLLANFPEVEHVVSKIGTAEVPTDPMAIEDADIMIILKDRNEWTSASNREDLIAAMKEVLEPIDYASFEFTQPIQLRFNELMTGAKTDVSLKIYGEDVAELKRIADYAAELIVDIPGAADVKVEQTEGLRQWQVVVNREQLSLLDVDIEAVNQAVRSAYAGEVAGTVYENERRSDLVVRLREADRTNLYLSRLMVKDGSGRLIPLSQVARVVEAESPMQISREDARRLIKVGVNVRDVDVATLVGNIEETMNNDLNLPPGYSIEYGGAFENLQHAVDRLAIALPIALFLILFLLYMAFNSVQKALLIFLAVPLSAVGGVLALWIRGLPFSISAGIGFIALFGVAVLNGIVLVNEFIRLEKDGDKSLQERIIDGAKNRLRPVLMTALVASLGFLPMAISTGSGAEVQRPLATVVIGGLVTATMLTLLVLPTVYYVAEKRKNMKNASVLLLLTFSLLPAFTQAQNTLTESEMVNKALSNRASLRLSDMETASWQTGEGLSWQLPDAGFGVQYGQINFAGNDILLSVEQSLGKPWQYGIRKEYYQAGAEVSLAERAATEPAVKHEVLTAYDSYLLAMSMEGIISEQVVSLKELSAAMNNAYELGNMSHLDLLLMQQLLREVDGMAVTVQLKKMESLARLKYLTADSLLQPEVRPFALRKPVLFVKEPTVSEVYLEPFRRELDQLEAKRKVIAAEALPDLSVGYFNQSLNGETGFGGVLAGLQFPLFASGRKTRMAIADIEKQQVEVTLDDKKNLLNSELIKAMDQLNVLQNILMAFGDDPLTDHLKALEELNELYASGQIGPEAYSIRYRPLLQSLFDWWDWVAMYNRAVLDIQLLTTTF